MYPRQIFYSPPLHKRSTRPEEHHGLDTRIVLDLCDSTSDAGRHARTQCVNRRIVDRDDSNAANFRQLHRFTHRYCLGAPYSRISGEGDACFLGNGAKLFDNRHNKRHTLLAAQLLGFTLGIAGNERTVRAGRGFSGAEDAEEVVHLPLELVRLAKTVNATLSEKVATSLPNATRR